MKKFSLILVIILIASCLGSGLTSIAFAASETIYTGVLEDLSKDETFDVSKYPEENKDIMDVFQVAESNAGEVFLYVYQPTGDKYTASEVRISTSIGENLAPQDYTLTLLNRNGTLAKYLVNDLLVKDDTVRYYLIVQIARPWNEETDGKLSGDSINITYSYSIAKQFTACSIDDNVTYTEIHRDVVEIRPDQRFDGSIRYSDGFNLYATQCDSWFIAFTCDYQIDKLMDADISFYTRFCSKTIGPFINQTEYKDPVFHTFTLTDKQEVNHEKRFLFFKSTYTWNRIEKASDFIAKEDLKSDVKDKVSSMQWVLRYTETTFGTSGNAMSGITTSWGTDVYDVTILRLHFESEGKQYNLGVVSNKVTPDNVPDNNPDDPLGALKDAIEKFLQFFRDVGDWLKEYWWVLILGIIVVGLIIALIIKGSREFILLVFKGLFKCIWLVIKYLFIGLGYVLASPVLLIIWIVRKVREKKSR